MKASPPSWAACPTRSATSEYAYVKQNKMTYAQLQNAAGNFVSPDDTAFKAAAAGADWNKSFYQVLTNQARQGCMADHRRHLHPGAQDAGQAAPTRPPC